MKKNMQNYCDVVKRVHPDARMRQEILSAAQVPARSGITQRSLMRGFILPAFSAAACFAMVLGGIRLWQENSGITVQTSMPEVEIVTGTSAPETTTAVATSLKTRTTQKTTALTTTTVTTITTAAPAYSEFTATTAAATAAPAVSATAAHSSAAETTAATTAETAAVVTLLESATSPADETAPAVTTAETEPAADPEWIAALEDLIAFYDSLEYRVVFAPLDVQQACWRESQAEAELIFDMTDTSQEAQNQQNLFLSRRTAELIIEALGDQTYALEDSIDATATLLSDLYAMGEITYDETFAYFSAVLNGEKLPEEIREKALSQETLKIHRIEALKEGLLNEKGENVTDSPYVLAAAMKRNLYQAFSVEIGNDEPVPYIYFLSCEETGF